MSRLHVKFTLRSLQARQAPDSRTSVYQKANEVTYQLKMKTSRAVFSEIQKKAGAFPFNIRNLEDEKRSRVGVQEAEQHGLIKPYEVQYVLWALCGPGIQLMTRAYVQNHPCWYICRGIPLYDCPAPSRPFANLATTCLVFCGQGEE